MVKERVVVFEDEHNFIAPRDKVYDKATGKSEFANQVGAMPSTPEGDAFTRYMVLKNQEVVIPQPSDADFCNKIQAFIRDNGGGKATPDQVMTAYQLFQNNCLEKPEPLPPKPQPVGKGAPLPVEVDLPPTTQPKISEVSFPKFDALSCDDLNSEIASIENTLATNKFDAVTKNIYQKALSMANSVKSTKCQPAAAPSVPTNPIETPAMTLPITSIGLGLRPTAGGIIGGGGGGGAEEETAQAPKKKSSPLIWIILGIGAIYLLTRKNS
jgi:hypothetical protein